VEAREKAAALYGTPSMASPRRSVQTWLARQQRSATPAVPSLVLHSTDCHFNGQVMFHASDPGREYTLGYSDCDFLLPEAADIYPRTCVIWQDRGRLFIRPAPHATVEVNGTPIVQKRELGHRDSVSLGSVFRFLAFTMADDSAHKRLLSDTPEEWQGDAARCALIKGVLGEDRAQLPMEMERAERYASFLGKADLGMAGVADFLQRSHRAQMMVEEANRITAAVKPYGSRQASFELMSVTAVLSIGSDRSALPELCVRLLRQSSGGEEEVQWTMPRFEEQLQGMRHAYVAYLADPARFALDPLSSPWADMTSSSPPTEFAQLQDECEQLRKRLQAIDSLVQGNKSDMPPSYSTGPAVSSPKAASVSCFVSGFPQVLSPTSPMARSPGSPWAARPISPWAAPTSPGQSLYIPVSPAASNGGSVSIGVRSLAA